MTALTTPDQRRALPRQARATPGRNATLLLAEDDASVAEVLTFSLRLTWPDWRVLIAPTGSEALRLFHEEHPHLAILDVGLPPPNGLEVCRRIREESPIPVMMLTGRGVTLDKVRALDLGADAYLTKPFDVLELHARLRALLRRAGPRLAPAPVPDVAAGDLTLNYATHEVRLRGKVVRLTSTEYRLLAELVRHAGMALPHQRLLERVWGPEYARETHYLKGFVGRLRRKLGDDADRPRYIQTVWGIGYRFAPAAHPLPSLSESRRP